MFKNKTNNFKFKKFSVKDFNKKQSIEHKKYNDNIPQNNFTNKITVSEDNTLLYEPKKVRIVNKTFQPIYKKFGSVKANHSINDSLNKFYSEKEDNSINNYFGSISNINPNYNFNYDYVNNLGSVGSDWVEYIGEVRNEIKHGEGIWELGNGDKFMGIFVNNIAEGNGEYWKKKTNEIIKGFWKDNICIYSKIYKI